LWLLLLATEFLILSITGLLKTRVYRGGVAWFLFDVQCLSWGVVGGSAEAWDCFPRLNPKQ
jgi:hypothetical protein